MAEEIARNEATGDFTNVVQAGTIAGDVHLHAPQTAARGPVPRPVGDWTPFDLDVHRAIVLSAANEQLPELPRYLRRTHDGELDAQLVDPTRSLMVVLTGGSSTGKTRALYESVRSHETLSNWPLHHPRTADGLVSLLRSGKVVPGSVLWLNETQNFLTGPAGEAAAACLRMLLDGSIPGPVVVLGTLWPQYWAELIADTTNDHPYARALLQHSVRRIRVAEQFSDADLADLRSGELIDPRLSQAASATGADRKVIQTLAGGPALVERFEHPDTPEDRYAAAIIAAVIDVRRLGSKSLLPRALLTDAAHGYLSEPDRIDPPHDWFAQGLARAADDAQYGITALVPRRHHPGAGPPDGYELHDYLEQHGRATRRRALVPDSLWEALRTHTTDPFDQYLFAENAYHRLLYRHGNALYRRSLSTANPFFQERMVPVLAEYGRVEEAVALLAEFDPEHDTLEEVLPRQEYVAAVDTLIDQRRDEDALAVLEGLIDARIYAHWATRRLAHLFVKLGREEDAIKTLKTYIERGHDNASTSSSRDIQLGGRWLGGDPSGSASEQLADLLVTCGRAEQALRLVRDRVDDGWGPGWLARQFAKAGNTEQLDRFAQVGSPDAEWLLTELRIEQDPAIDVIEALRALGPNQPPRGKVDRLVELLTEQGRFDHAQELIFDRATSSLHFELREETLRGLVRAMAAHNRAAEAIAFLQRIVVSDFAGHVPKTGVKAMLADLLAEQGRWPEVLELLRVGEQWALEWLPEHLAKNGKLDLLRQLADTGNDRARYELIRLFMHGRNEREALEVLQNFTYADNSATRRLAQLLADHGKVAELRESAARGDRYSSQQLVKLAQRGDFPGAERLLEFGLNTDGSIPDGNQRS
ncbi:hypothetical protein MOQ72_15290 [Saccharopolyspora sp. K220]|uniref:hypothetical protein n=1 Tax=Saccharopolyspora soli TaxID=2926618 RepID=UPI001F596DA5|nr:hypothetical protein [Saccharopolyspora soli]MCI2418805.1 hypothetical protein [Saccharopolyspora soli]